MTVCRVLFFLTEDDTTRVKAVGGVGESNCMRILSDLFHRFVKEGEIAVIEHILSVWLQLMVSHEAHGVADYIAKHCLKDMRTAFEELPKEVTVQQCLIALIASMGVSSDIKMAVASSQLLDGACLYKNHDSSIENLDSSIENHNSSLEKQNHSCQVS